MEQNMNEIFRSKYLKVTEMRMDAKRTTMRYSVCAVDGSGQMGTIKWYSPWHGYCFFPFGETVFDKGCLRQVADWCHELTVEYNKFQQALKEE
jgi:hypothetical protein